MDVVRIGAGHMRGDVRCLDCGLYCARARWVSMLRPTDIVAARIDGLREGAKLAREQFFMQARGHGYTSDETPCWDDVGPALDARIAELEATAPEMSGLRAKAEAFDATLAMFKDSDDDHAWWFVDAMEERLAEAKRKGAGT